MAPFWAIGAQLGHIFLTKTDFAFIFPEKGLSNTCSMIKLSELVAVVIKFQLHLAAQMCRWWTVCRIIIFCYHYH